MLMLCDCTHLQELKCTFVSNVIKFRVFTKNVGYSISESFVKEKKLNREMTHSMSIRYQYFSLKVKNLFKGNKFI